ncbi:hypothetical protein DRP53_05450 [candidate division WOR-3 bacterium]|uniref:DUF3098 domain-containing protein n=1 Tax=candidate division WOR-3 bacterium TaxID=2052148 RepID=A0A660SHW6_UNCW3|nr:MAG: hypothetical protein DRP53_05450 [candidate division WOR-3 bacterium]
MAKKKKKREERMRIEFKGKNLILLLAGIGSIILGFYTLSLEMITLSPILLVLGYLVLIPLSILLR